MDISNHIRDRSASPMDLIDELARADSSSPEVFYCYLFIVTSLFVYFLRAI